jgi:hypothetical protein
MKNLLLFISFITFSLIIQAQSSISGTLNYTDPVYNRVVAGNPPTILSGVGVAVYYKVLTVAIALPGSVTFTCSSNFDSFGTLYGTAGFDPSAALTNSLIANDDSISSDFGFSYNFTTPGNYFLVVSTFDVDSGSYTITSSAGAVLPVRLLSFSADKIGSTTNEIKWTTAEEVNIDYYKLQHSNNGRLYTDLSVSGIPAKNLSFSSTYIYRDPNPFAGYNFYRLMIVEKSGHISYSPIAVINNNEVKLPAVKVFPNPATDFIQIEPGNLQNNQLCVSLLTANGQILLSKEYKETRQRIISIDVKKLSPGIYYLKIKSGQGTTTKAFIKR